MPKSLHTLAILVSWHALKLAQMGLKATILTYELFACNQFIKETQFISGLLTDPCVFHAVLHWWFEFLSHGESTGIIKWSVGGK